MISNPVLSNPGIIYIIERENSKCVKVLTIDKFLLKEYGSYFYYSLNFCKFKIISK